ncbi:conserved exported hypothetical protein [Vibrio crassostreae]|nr:conserved exported hypothetical protein [Vibrio crassostreae]CAK3650417.1 conserved exported hypothetical protein [Vibrio crassostreae]
MKIKKIILTVILSLGTITQVHAGGGAIAFTPLKTPIIVPDGDTSDWNQVKDKSLIHIVHQESGIEFYTLAHQREVKRVTEIENQAVRSFLIKVPKTSEVKEALITLRDVKDGKFWENFKPVEIDMSPYPDIYDQAPTQFKEVDTALQNIKISRHLDNGGINGYWKRNETNRSQIKNTKGTFEGSLSLTPITLTSYAGETDIYTYFPIRFKRGPFLVHSVDDGDYEYLELTVPSIIRTGYKKRIFITYTFARGSEESFEISDNLFPSLGEGISAHAAICGSSCPHDPYEALESFYADGVSVQISATGQLGPFLGTASVTTNFEETLSDVSASVGNPDVSLEIGVAAFNTSNLSDITEGPFVSASFDFQPVVGPGVTMVTSPDFSVIGFGGTFGITGLPGYNMATGWGIDGGGGSTTTETTNDNTSSGNGNSGSGNSDNDWGSDHDSWGHDDDHGPSYGGNDDHDWSNDDDDNSGYFD